MEKHRVKDLACAATNRSHPVSVPVLAHVTLQNLRMLVGTLVRYYADDFHDDELLR
jgi:hypothetical protein